jgi:hypothetical protein
MEGASGDNVAHAFDPATVIEAFRARHSDALGTLLSVPKMS